MDRVTFALIISLRDFFTFWKPPAPELPQTHHLLRAAAKWGALNPSSTVNCFKWQIIWKMNTEHRRSLTNQNVSINADYENWHFVLWQVDSMFSFFTYFHWDAVWLERFVFIHLSGFKKQETADLIFPLNVPRFWQKLTREMKPQQTLLYFQFFPSVWIQFYLLVTNRQSNFPPFGISVCLWEA